MAAAGSTSSGRFVLPSLDDLDDIVARDPARSTWAQPAAENGKDCYFLDFEYRNA
eukprot:SAG31_NODE_348_length_17296_cov_5.089482_7_plen_55_part_00